MGIAIGACPRPFLKNSTHCHRAAIGPDHYFGGRLGHGPMEYRKTVQFFSGFMPQQFNYRRQDFTASHPQGLQPRRRHLPALRSKSDSQCSEPSTDVCEPDLALQRPSSPWPIIWLAWSIACCATKKTMSRKVSSVTKRNSDSSTSNASEKKLFHPTSNSLSLNNFHHQLLES